MSTVLPLMPYSWHQDQWQQLQMLIEAQRMPHALLLAGSADTGKGRFAQALAQQLLCEVPAVGGACGQCKQCLLVNAGSHPDLRIIEPEGAGNRIKIDHIRAGGDFMAKTAQQGGWKVVIIQPAENMNVNAANALLKNLEEPGDRTLILLVTHQPERIAATVRSRCRIVRFPLPPLSTVSEWLKQVVGDTADIPALLAASGGRPLQAVRLLESDTLGQMQHFTELLNQVADGSVSPLKAAQWCFKEAPTEAVDWLQLNVARDIKQSPASRKGRLLFKYLDKLNAAKGRMQSTANPNLQLAWEELMLDWQALCEHAG